MAGEADGHAATSVNIVLQTYTNMDIHRTPWTQRIAELYLSVVREIVQTDEGGAGGCFFHTVSPLKNQDDLPKVMALMYPL